MKGLGKLVLLAGKNGSGKSRLLSLLKDNDLISQRIENDTKPRILANLNNTRKALTQINRTIESYVDRGISNLSKAELDDYNFSLNKRIDFENEIKESESLLKIELLEFDDEYPKSEVYEFVPKFIQMKDPDELTKFELKSCLRLEKNLHINKIGELSFGVLQSLQDYVVNKSEISKLELKSKENFFSKYEKLRKLVNDFLGTDIGRNDLGDALIFSQALGSSKMSEGQKVLFQLCIALLENDISIQDAILILDEPENHLHPKILIDVIDRILELNTFGQVWIATHSIPLIAHYDPSSLWLMDNNTVSFSGRNPELVIDSLVGEAEKQRLSEFLNLPAAFASVKFASECLLGPEILSTSLDDPQTNQIYKIINTFKTSVSTFKVLDYGAGSGRLLKLIAHLEGDVKYKSSDKVRRIEYSAYDVPDVKADIREQCLQVMKDYYGMDKRDLSRRYFSSVQDMYLLSEGHFDLVVMCNVFHEIDPTQWMNLFSNGEVFQKYLNGNGYLLIVEDHQMPVGEKAYKNGFMVFGERQFRLLFDIKDNMDYVIHDARNDGRLLAHLIPKKYLQNISYASILNSIRDLKSISLSMVDRIRREEVPSFKSGMKLSFWLNQYANSSLNLRSFDSTI